MSVTLESATTDLIAAIDAATHEWLVRCVMKTYVQQLGTPRLEVEEKLLVAARLAAEQGANVVVCLDVGNRVGTGRFPDWVLIDEFNGTDCFHIALQSIILAHMP